MKQTLIYLTAGLLALLLQTTVLSHLPIKPDLILILVVCLGLSNKPVAGAVLAFLFGCLMDVFAGSTLGFFALTKTLVFFFTYSVKGHLFFDYQPAKVLLILVSALIEAVLFLLLARLTFHWAIVPSSMAGLILGPILLTTLVAPVCFVLLKRSGVLVY
jgi:rod shape-determining protein MreD